MKNNIDSILYPEYLQVGGGWIPAGHTRTITRDSDIKSLSESELEALIRDIRRFQSIFHKDPLIFKLVPSK